MTERVCELCTRPVLDAKVCTRCRDDFTRDLGDIAALDSQLEIVLTRQTAYTERNGPRSSGRPLPVDMRASEAAWVLRNTLTTWCRVLGWTEPLTERADGVASQTPASNGALSGWLLTHAEAVRHHEAAGEIIEEIESAVALVRTVVDAPANRTTFPVGPCPEVPCPGEIRAFIPADERPARMECTVDPEHMYEAYQWMRAGARILKRKAEMGAA